MLGLPSPTFYLCDMILLHVGYARKAIGCAKEESLHALLPVGYV
jgi:hypothetical protein